MIMTSINIDIDICCMYCVGILLDRMPFDSVERFLKSKTHR